MVVKWREKEIYTSSMKYIKKNQIFLSNDGYDSGRVKIS